MKWNELTTLQKIATVTGISSAFAGFVICLLDIAGMLTDYFAFTTPLWCVFSLSNGLLYRKTRLILNNCARMHLHLFAWNNCFYASHIWS